MADEDERREFERIYIKLGAELTFANGEKLQGRVRDISMRGVFVVLEGAAQAPTPECRVRLVFGELPDALVLRAAGKVMHQHPDGFGVQIIELEVEDFHHLYRLMRHNAPDPERIDEEFYSHVGLKKR